MKTLALTLFILSLVACGGGSSGSSSSNNTTPSVTPLVLGTESVDTSNDDDGVVNITFPSADGDLPMITAVTVDGSSADGWANLPNPSDSNYDITTDGVDIYMPTSGNYTVTITVEDNGDAPVQHVVNVNIPGTSAFPLAGNVEDGPAGSESGVNTTVRLYWHPLSSSKSQIATLQSNAASNGSFSFAQLVGSVDDFEIRVDGGTD